MLLLTSLGLSPALAAPVNVALNQPVSASSQWAEACAAAKANDGSDNASDSCGGWSPDGSDAQSCGGWSPDGTDAQSWWQVDLGQAYAIGSIELVTRQNCCDDPETRQNFELRASNDPGFASSVVLGSQGSTPLPFQSTWTQSVTDTNSYRYIRATKPGYFFIAELKVLGAGTSNQPPSINLTSPANNASFSAPANITLSASASDADGTITQVEFYNGSTLIATDSTAADGWGITWSGVPPGSYSVSAKAFDNNNASTASAVANVTVTGISSGTNLALNRPVSASSVYADICAAAKANDGSENASDSCGGWSPTGADAQSWWQVDLGQAYTITTLELITRQNCCDDPETRQNFEIRASNDPSFASSVVLGSQGNSVLPFKATWTQNVSDANAYRYIRATRAGYFFIAELRVFGGTAQANQPPSVNLTSPPNNATYLAPANIPITASASDSDGTIARVEFYDGSTLIGTATSAPYSLDWANVSQGSYSLSAKAFDNADGTAASTNVSVTVNAGSNLPPSVALTSPSNGATFSAPATITLTANATDADGSVAKVEFYNGSTLIATDNNGADGWSTSWSNVSQGNYVLSAKAFDNINGIIVSENVDIIVGAGGEVAVAPISFVYDEVGRLVGMYDAAGNSAEYRYDALGNLSSVTRKSTGAVSLLEFTPQTASAGMEVTITGTGFSTSPDANIVTFNGTAATVRAASANTLQVIVPAGAANGPIRVSSPSGSALSSGDFIVASGGGFAPAISAFAPSVGASGTSISLSGANFQSNASDNKVRINGIALKITSATATTISATVPPNVGSGKVKVITPFGSTLSGTDFYLTPAPHTPADVEVAVRMDYPGSKTVTIPTSGKIALVLIDGMAGQGMSVKRSGGTFSTSCHYMSIFKPDGSALLNAALTCGPSDFTDPLALPTTGTYTIVIDPYTTGTGSITLELLDVPSDATATTTIGAAPVTLTTSVPGQNAKLSFNGMAGQRMSLKRSGVTFASTCYSMTILKPDGAALVPAGISCSPSDFVDTLALPTTGTYTIVIDPYTTGTGSITLELLDVPSDATATTTIGAAPVTLTTSVAGQNAKLLFEGMAG